MSSLLSQGQARVRVRSFEAAIWPDEAPDEKQKLRTKKLRIFFGSDTTKAKRFLVSIALAVSYEPDPDAAAALSRPCADLIVAAAWLYRYYRRVTPEMLADHIGISRSNLFWRHRGGLMKMIKQYLQASFDPRASIDLPGGRQVDEAATVDSPDWLAAKY